MDSPKVLAPRNRNVSSSTGLVKFNLSPKRAGVATSETGSPRKERPQRSPGAKSPEKLPSLRIVPTKPEKSQVPEKCQDSQPKEPQSDLSSRNELLSKYAAKQTKLMEVSKQKELLEFEILEIQAQLQAAFSKKEEPKRFELKKTASTFFQSPELKNSFSQPPELKTLKKTASTFFQSPELKSRASTLFQPSPELKSRASTFFQPPELKKVASQLFSPELKNKPSFMNNKFMSEVKETLDKQQEEFENFTKKGTDLAKNFLTSFSPKKEPVSVADSSLLMENISDHSVLENSILLSESDSAIDIDDYESD